MENQLEAFAESVTSYVPSVLGALIVLLIGWLIAKGIKNLTERLLRRTKWDAKFAKDSDIDTNSFVAKILYYLIMIVVMLVVLEIIGVHQVLDPLKNMLNEFLSFIPNLIGALLIGFIGYLLATFVSNLVNIGGSVLDKIVDKTGFKDTKKLVNVVKKVVFIVIFVPFLIQGFNSLELDAISTPANNLLYGFTDMIGEIIVAALVLVVFIYGGKFLSALLEDLFRSMGMDNLAEKISIQKIIGSGQSLSKIVANLIYFFIAFFGVITAVEILELSGLAIILHDILEVTGQILFGLVILSVGNFISLLVYDMMTKSENNRFIASIVRVATLALFIAIALRTMGIANEIVELAFGLILGAIAVAVALSYGLGGREAAGDHFKDIVGRLRSEAKASQSPSKPTASNDSPGE